MWKILVKRTRNLLLNVAGYFQKNRKGATKEREEQMNYYIHVLALSQGDQNKAEQI